MRTSSVDSYSRWAHASYEVRARSAASPTYLWGSAGITKGLDFGKPLVLHIHNDLFGEVIAFGTQTAAGIQASPGTLQPGECVAIPLNGIPGVFAACEKEAAVCCLIK